MTKIDVLDFASLFLWVASKDDIEFERQRLEATYQHPIEVFEIEHPTLSGARCTRVSWKRP
ncbi:MAG: hypothetical protein J2P55_17200 [Rhizobiales bacterium]|nr:hypothetical protein [Hyphomicrobiales bacterium]